MCDKEGGHVECAVWIKKSRVLFKHVCTGACLVAYEAFAFSFSSNFRLAARIISSLLFCRLDCLSFLSWLHAFALGCSSGARSDVCDSFDDRLYRVMRSGCTFFATGTGVRAGTAAARGAGGANDAGACSQLAGVQNDANAPR